MKKILLTESEKKAIILEREQAIVKSFAKTFNTIKRIDENELTEERPISARYGADPTPEQSASIDKFIKDRNEADKEKKDKGEKSEIKSNDTKISENDGEDYEAASRGIEHGINPYQDQPVMDEKANSIDTITKALVDGGFFGPTDIKNGEMLNSFSKNKLVHNEYIRNAIKKIGEENNLPYDIVDVYWHKFW